jgi:glycine oxidase
VPLDSSRTTSDVLVAGRGLIGLSCAVAAAERGLTVRVIAELRVGEASLAAAGLLAPSIEREEGHSGEFAIAARDRYPDYVAWLRERTGILVPLNRDGIIQVAVSDAGVRGLRRSIADEAQWLDIHQLVELEPALDHALGGVIHPRDGWVDNVVLHRALVAVAKKHGRIAFVEDTITGVAFGDSVRATGRSGTTYDAPHIVLAAGAWSPTINGLPRSLPVEPVRGQMISYSGSPITRALYGPTGYVVPRTDGRTLIGATSERAGFESITTDEGISRLRKTAAEVLPRLARVEPIAKWAGLRPMSADLHPILGPDPDEPRLLYATGHSRNGVLMTPLTGDCIAGLLAGEPPPIDIGGFSIGRFRQPATSS